MLLRSSLMLFTAILNRIFVNKKLYAHHMFAMLMVGLGLTIVGILAEVYKETEIVELDEIK